MRNPVNTLLVLIILIGCNSSKNLISVNDNNKEEVVKKYSIQSNSIGTPSQIKFSKESDIQADEIFSLLSDDFGFSEDDEYRLYKTEQDNIGFTHYRYQQYYKGVPVDGGEYLVHEKDGTVNTANGNFYTGFDIDVNPSITEPDGLEMALGFVTAKEYMWNSENDKYYPKGELWISPVNGQYELENFKKQRAEAR